MTKEDKLIDIVLECGTFQTKRMVKKYENKSEWKPSNPKNILSFIPGTILEIKVEVGNDIKAGEPLMLFNAMKMENVITSSIDGKIKSINVKIGQNVPKGHIMIELV